ncbi:SCP2 sterol-binding domain-containing protein [Spirillospora albida]|uniref:SCP2 sterol-binding domain-containing protein n=1 Tax=Spirillospora albida TaxID=58123 RepID=UPI0006915018|nr:SCP2 sterol-binding domain-containing protein [Spirillospora albida]
MTEPRPGEAITAESVAMAFRTTYRPEAARDATVGYEVRMGGFTLRLQITAGALAVGVGPHPAPDLVIERMNEQGIHALMTGAKTPDQALADGTVRVEGDPALLHRFVQAFRF